MIPVVFDRSERLAGDIWSFYFKPKSKLRYTAGQFIELKLPHDDPDDRGESRWFTLSSSPAEEFLTLTTRIVNEPSTFKATLRDLKKGTHLKLVAPMGDFVLPKDPAIPLLFIAGGIGCTPFRSMVKSLLDTGEKREISLIYATQDPTRIVFQDVFELLGNNFITYSTNDKRLSANEIIQHRKTLDTYVYVSGPEPMVEDLEKELRDAGLKSEHFHGDFFPGYPSR